MIFQALKSNTFRDFEKTLFDRCFFTVLLFTSSSTVIIRYQAFQFRRIELESPGTEPGKYFN